MKPPEFPRQFMLDHCEKVIEARDWRRIYNVTDRTDEDDLEFADCAFHKAGSGMACENCDVFMTRPMKTQEEKEYLVRIEEYYRLYAEYHEWQEKERLDREKAEHFLGSGI